MNDLIDIRLVKLKLHVDNSLMTDDKNISCQQAFGKKAGSVVN